MMRSRGSSHDEHWGASGPDCTAASPRAAVMLLLDAAERAAVTPLASPRLHAFAYLSDVLSPVWDLPAFDGKILKIDGGPHYPDLQEELDHLVVLGLVEVSDLEYVGRGENGARLEGKIRSRLYILLPCTAARRAGRRQGIRGNRPG